MWNEELLRKGFENASLRRVAWRFVRTRVLVGISIYFLSLICGFLGPVSEKIKSFQKFIIQFSPIFNFTGHFY